MIDFHLHWDGSDYGDLPFDILELLVCPRVGESLWFRHTNDDGDHICDYNVEIVGIQHVAATEDSDPYIELHVEELSRSDPDEDEEKATTRCEHCADKGVVM